MPENRIQMGSQVPVSELQEAGDGSASLPTHSLDGVDLTLIRWMLSLTPDERLEVLQANGRSIMSLLRDTPEA